MCLDNWSYPVDIQPRDEEKRIKVIEIQQWEEKAEKGNESIRREDMKRKVFYIYIYFLMTK